jgi:hypothetical protein
MEVCPFVVRLLKLGDTLLEVFLVFYKVLNLYEGVFACELF